MNGGGFLVYQLSKAGRIFPQIPVLGRFWVQAGRRRNLRAIWKAARDRCQRSEGLHRCQVWHSTRPGHCLLSSVLAWAVTGPAAPAGSLLSPGPGAAALWDCWSPTHHCSSSLSFIQPFFPMPVPPDTHQPATGLLLGSPLAQGLSPTTRHLLHDT